MDESYQTRSIESINMTIKNAILISCMLGASHCSILGMFKDGSQNITHNAVGMGTGLAATGICMFIAHKMPKETLKTGLHICAGYVLCESAVICGQSRTIFGKCNKAIINGVNWGLKKIKGTSAPAPSEETV